MARTRAMLRRVRHLPPGLLLCALCLIVACGPEIQVERDLVYDTRFGAATTLDVYRPATPEGPAPLLILVHGGGWMSDSKSDLGSLPSRFAQEGFVTASVNYRLVPQVQFPEPVRDVACAVSWLVANAESFGARPERFALWGYSAGGHLVSLLAVNGDSPELAPDCGLPPPPRPIAVISGAGPQDLRALAWASEVQNLLGGTEAEVPEAYAAASPLDHVDPGEPPFLFIHGEQDVFVPVSHSRRMHAALQAQGNSSELLVLHGGGHVLNPGPSSGQLSWEEFSTDSPEAWSAMLSFLQRELSP